MRSPCPEKQGPGRALGPAVPQVCCHGLSHLAGQGERLAPLSLAGDGNGAFAPIKIVQRECGDLASAQSQSDQQQQDGVVTPSHGCVAVTAGEQGLDLLRGERFRQSGQAPVNDWEHCAGEVGWEILALVQVAQETAQCRYDQLGASPAETLGLAQHEVVGVPGCQPLQCHRLSAEPLGEKCAHNRQVVADRCPAEAALVHKEAFVGVRDPVNRAIAVRLGSGSRNPAVRSQMVQQLPGRGGFAATGPALQFASSQESIDPPLVEGFSTEAFVHEPSTEITDGCKLDPDGVKDVSRCGKQVGEAVEIRCQRTGS